MLSQEKVKEIKEKYKKGTKIKCLHMDDPQAIPSGTVGTVLFVDDAGQIHMKWPSGSILALIEGVDDFCIVKEDD